MTQGKNLNAFLLPASLKPSGSTEKRLITISFINNSKDALTSVTSVCSVRDNSFFPTPNTLHLTPYSFLLTPCALATCGVLQTKLFPGVFDHLSVLFTVNLFNAFLPSHDPLPDHIGNFQDIGMKAVVLEVTLVGKSVQ